MLGILTFFLSLIEAAAILLFRLIRYIAHNIKEGAMVRGKPAGEKSATKAGRNRTETLSEEQREQIVNAILDTSLLLNDRVYDSLSYEGEALYEAVAAVQCSEQDFELQYGGKEWLAAWIRALSVRFDCQTEYNGSGIFRCCKEV